jgi:hypothetical protein
LAPGFVVTNINFNLSSGVKVIGNFVFLSTFVILTQIMIAANIANQSFHCLHALIKKIFHSF